MGIIQSKIIQPNIIQPNQIVFSQMKYYSAKWEYYSAKLRGGWRPKPDASWRNHYIKKYAGRREYYDVDEYKDKSPQLAAACTVFGVILPDGHRPVSSIFRTEYGVDYSTVLYCGSCGHFG